MFVVVASIVVPPLWTFCTYRNIQGRILAGDLVEAERLVRKAGRSRWFQPDWTPVSRLPDSPRLHRLYQRIDQGAYYRDGSTLLEHAARFGASNVVAVLLANGAAVDPFGDGGVNAVNMAVSSGDTNVVALLIARGARLNSANPNRPSALIVASAYQSDTNMIDFLLAQGADINVRYLNGTPLDAATLLSPTIVPHLRSRGALHLTNLVTAPSASEATNPTIKKQNL
jgi:hypothetical protein